MATTYNDIIRKRSGKAAYSLEEEKGGQWESFIPNEQFNTVLRTVLKSVRGNDIDTHKSFWINGTYGTGKSHAAAVIAHLLCDPADDIRRWMDYEYGAERFKGLHDAVFALRRQKRLLPVKIEGLCDMAHVSDLPLVLQTAVAKALADHGFEPVVDTDFDELVAHVERNGVIWDDLIERNTALKSVAASRDKLAKKLREKDMGTFRRARDAQRAADLAILIGKDNVGAWLVEVQNKLRETSDYRGLLILWDEFTDVMNDAIGLPVLKALQTIAQKFANEENDSFLFLISHPSAFNKLSNEEIKQTDGRYHRMKYNMEPVSAFKIMSRKLEITDPVGHAALRDRFFASNGELLDRYTATSNDPQETRQDLQNLFPIHPATANLATHYATVVGSSSRSVFEFIGQNDAMERFLADREAFAGGRTVTADYLWDFVLKVFQDDVQNYAAVTERYNTYRHMVEERGPAACAVFKGTLLLNAFNNISGNNNGLVTPTRENICALFAGTHYAAEVDAVLDWFNDQSVIQRAPGGIFSVQFSALPAHEIEELRTSLANDPSKYKYVSSILRFGDTARNFVEKKYIQKNIRPYRFEFYSAAANDSLLKDSVKRARRAARASDLFLALFFARNNEEAAHLRDVADSASAAGRDGDKELRDTVFIVFDTPFGDREYARFIEYMANYSAAHAHGFLDQVNVHGDHAKEMIGEWLQNAQRGNATIYLNGIQCPIAVKHLSTTLNNIVAPQIFPLGPDAVEMLRNKAPNTFWKPMVSREIIRTFIFATTKSELLEISGQMKPIQYLIQDALDENLAWRDDMPAGHPAKAVFDFVQAAIDQADKSAYFNFADKFDGLCRPPYGLSANYASAAMVALALRGWSDRIFSTLGKPLDQNTLADAVTELFNVWEKGKNASKLNFKFQTREEGELCRALVQTFKLDKLDGYNDVSSLKDARFAITSTMLNAAQYPLWSLKHMDADFCNRHPKIFLNDSIRKLLDNVVAICSEKDTRDNELIKETLDLIDTYRADIPDILAKPGSFRNGFENFLLAEPTVGLQKAELEDAHAHICKNLQSSIGYWTEEEVRQALRDWRLSQKSNSKQYQIPMTERGGQCNDGEQKLTPSPMHRDNPARAADRRDMARRLVGRADAALLRAILERMVDMGHEAVIDIILEHQKSVQSDV